MAIGPTGRKPVLQLARARVASKSIAPLRCRTLRSERFFHSAGRFARTAAGVRVRVIVQLVPLNFGVLGKRIQCYAIATAALEMTMRQDELRWLAIVAEVLRKLTATHSDLEVLADFKMKMRVIKSMRVAQGRDLL